jgi:hypothetical protein
MKKQYETVIKHGKTTNDLQQQLYKEKKKTAEIRGLSFGLSFRSFIDLIYQECFYCSEKPGQNKTAYNPISKKIVGIQFNGIDRVDSAIGYEPGNCVPCCWMCNVMKNKYSLDEFFLHVSRIYRKHFQYGTQDKKK